MKRTAHLLLGLLAFSGAAASARPIDCARVAGQLDGVICADPQMRDHQGRIAAAYVRATEIWGGAIAPYVRREHQEWLLAFRTVETIEAGIDEDCVLTDPDCIRDQMRRRVEDMENGAYVHSGVYRAANGMKLLLLPAASGGYRVRAYDPTRLSKANILTLEADGAARWEGAAQMVSLMGDGNGRPLASDDGCTLRLTPEPLAIQVVQTGFCGSIRFDGVYRRQLDETLRAYELKLH